MEYGRSCVRGARASACLNEDGAGTPYQPHEQLPRNIEFSLKHRLFVQNGKILRRAVVSSIWRIVILCYRIHSDNVWRVIIIHRFRGVCCGGRLSLWFSCSRDIKSYRWKHRRQYRKVTFVSEFVRALEKSVFPSKKSVLLLYFEY